MGWHKWVASGLKVATSWIPGVGTAVEEGLDHWGARQERRSLMAALLDAEEQTWRADASPAALLRADFGVVPFHGREAEIQDLDRWSDASEPLALRLYTAPGGFGKTRLLRHFVRLRRAAGWDAGVLSEATSGEALSMLLTECKKPLLMVVDYAESRGAHVEAVVLAARDTARSRVRLVLLARAEGDWWSELKRAENGVGDFFQGPAVEGPVPLRPLTSSIEARRASYDSAIHAFGKVLGKPDATTSAAPTLDHEDFERVLLVHAAALAAVEGEQVPSHRLLDWLLTREELGIDRVRERQAGLGPEIQRATYHAAALVTLAQGADSRDETVEIISRAPILEDQSRARREQVAEILHVLYQGRRWCDGVEPDLVGEHLAERHLCDAPELLDAAFGVDVPEARLEAGLTVLNRLAQRRHANPRLLKAVIERGFRHLASPAVRVAVASGDPIGPVLAEVLADVMDPEVARQVERTLPFRTTSLREVAAQVEELLWRDLRAGQAEPMEIAHRSNSRSTRLADIGRWEEALEASRESVRIHRDLAEARPDAYRAHLAASLHNLANRLANVGRPEDALAPIREAVEIRRGLAEAEPDAFRVDLAISLNNLSTSLARVGRSEEAMQAIREAVDINRGIAESRPNGSMAELAASLNTLSNRLGDVGQRKAALEAIHEAVDIYRDLAQARADAFRPDLVTSLNNLSIRFADIGRREEALQAIREAVEISRDLAKARPDAFRPDLATRLNNLSAHLVVVGRRLEALETIREAVEIRRELAEARPDAFRADLAISLNNLSNLLAIVGQSEEALQAIREAVEISRGIVESRPDASKAQLATSLNNLSNRLANFGRHVEALDPIREAVEIRRKLAEASPDAFGADLAQSLGAYHLRLRNTGQTESAMRAIQEAMDLLQPIFTQFPRAFEELMKAVSADYRHTATECGVEPDWARLRTIEEMLTNLQSAG